MYSAGRLTPTGFRLGHVINCKYIRWLFDHRRVAWKIRRTIFRNNVCPIKTRRKKSFFFFFLHNTLKQSNTSFLYFKRLPVNSYSLILLKFRLQKAHVVTKACTHYFNIYASLIFRIRRIYFCKNIKVTYLIIMTRRNNSEALALQIFSAFHVYSIVDEKSYWFYSTNITPRNLHIA